MYKYDVAILPDDVQFSLITFSDNLKVSDNSNPPLYSVTNDTTGGSDELYMDMSGANKSMPGYVVMNRPSTYQNPCTRGQFEVISLAQDVLLRPPPQCSEGPPF